MSKDELHDRLTKEDAFSGTPEHRGLINGMVLDAEVCQQAICEGCGHKGLELITYRDEAGDYRAAVGLCPKCNWSIFRSMNAQQLADVLQDLAEHVNLRRYKKHPRGPKKKPTQRTAYKNGGHVSTAKILIKKI